MLKLENFSELWFMGCFQQQFFMLLDIPSLKSYVILVWWSDKAIKADEQNGELATSWKQMGSYESCIEAAFLAWD